MDETEARRKLDRFLRRHFGEELAHPTMGPIGVREEFTAEFANAFVFVVNTLRAIETRNPADGLMSGGVIVPKDGSAVHWAPTVPSVPEYLSQVGAGDQQWPRSGAATVTYYALVDEDSSREDPLGIARRRVTDEGTFDETFTRNLKWEPTQYFEKYRLGHNEVDHVEITESGAEAFIEMITRKLGSWNLSGRACGSSNGGSSVVPRNETSCRRSNVLGRRRYVRNHVRGRG